MSTTIYYNPAGSTGRPLTLRTLVSDVCSFEGAFVLFLYSNVFQFLWPQLPVDTTIIFLAAGVLLGGWIIVREGIYMRGLTLVVAFVPYLLWLLLSATWSPSRVLKIEYLQIMFTLNLWCLIATAMIISHKRERMLRFLRFMTVMSLIVATIGVVIYFRYGSFKFAGWEGGRAYNQWGRAVVNGAVVLLFLFLRSRAGSVRQLCLGVLLGLCVFFIFVASSRSALLSLITPCLLLLAVTLVPRGPDGLRLPASAILLPLAMAAVVTIIAALVASGHRVDTIARLLSLYAQADNVEMIPGANRWDYYAEAVRQIIQSPLIGHGVRSFAILYRHAEEPGSHPHNVILEILSETGAVGLILFLLFIYVAVRPLGLRRLRADPMLLLLGMLFVSRLTATMFGADLSNQQELFVFVGILALVPMAPRGRPHSWDGGHVDNLSMSDTRSLRRRPAAP